MYRNLKKRINRSTSKFKARAVVLAKMCFLDDQHEIILARWEKASRELLPASNGKARTALLDHLPELLEALCDTVGRGDYHAPTKVSRVHGRQRHSFKDYTLDQVLGDYTLLRRIVEDVVAEKEGSTISDFRLIAEFFDSASSTAATEFARLREAELEVASGQISRANSDLERFAAVAAHDLRSPIATVISYTELLLDGATVPAEQRQRYIGRMQALSLRMLNLIDHLLQFSKVGHEDEKFRVVDLNAVARETLANLDQQISSSEAKIVIDPLPSVQGSSTLLGQLLQNLVANSLKFTKPGTAPQITIRDATGVEDGPGVVKISVEDKGVGFSAEKSAEIFKPFARAHALSEFEGSGLGLATCQRVVELHGGKISASSENGAGSKFLFTLPRP